MVLITNLPPLGKLTTILLDSILIVILVLPALYLFLFRPLVMDNAARAAAEKSLHESEVSLKRAQRMASVGSWEYHIAFDRLVMSEEMLRIHGIAEENNTFPAQAAIDRFVYPDDRELVGAELRKIQANTESAPIFYRIVRENGDIRWIEATQPEIKCSDEGGRPTVIIGAIQDITARRQAEEELAEKTRTSQILLDAFPSVTLLLRPDSREVVAANKAGVEAGVKVGSTCYSTWAKRSEPCPWCKAPEAWTTNKEQRCEPVYEDTTWDAHWIPISDDLYMHYAIDISETRRLQQQESRAERLETAGQVAGQVAHDFNNLLAPLMAYPEFIRDELSSDHPALAYLDDIENSAKKIADINQQLLTLGRRGYYNQDALNLNAIITQTIKEISPHPETLICDLDLSEDLIDVLAGSSQIHRVLMNLIVNARDAMHDIGQLTIRTENYYADDTTVAYGRVPRGEYVKVTVSDTGCGIPAKMLPTIFDPFVTSKTTDKKRGSGLGLSVVAAVVKDHGGYLDLDSEEGKGTSFYLYFPVTRQIQKNDSIEEVAGGTESILVIDDDHVQREVSSKILGKLGYAVTVVESGEKAIQLLKERPHDLLVLDMVMPPGIDGAETYRQAVVLNPYQRAIMVSGFSETDRVMEAQKLGAGDFVKKPLTSERLATAVRRELEREKQPVIV